MSADSRKLPSVETLFKQSWHTFKNAWLKLLFLTLLSFGFFAIILILALIIVAVLGVGGALFNPKVFQNPASLLPLITGLGVVGLIFLILMIVVGLAMQIVTIKIVTNTHPKQLALIPTFRNSIKLVWPFFISSLAVGLITTGWAVFLLIPGIIVGLLLSFWSYALVADGFKGLDPLRHSLALVKAHFWGVISRLLLITVLGLGIQLLLTMLLGRNSGFESLLSLIASVAFSWYALCYSAVLYKQAEVGMEKSLGSLKGLLVGAIIGWLVLTLVIYGVTQFGQQFPKTKSPNETPSNFSQNSPAPGLQEN